MHAAVLGLLLGIGSPSLCYHDTHHEVRRPVFEPVTSGYVQRIMEHLQPSAPWIMTYGETASAIAEAANTDPLWPHHEDGARKTAVLLATIAWYESRYHANAVHTDTDGTSSFGLFQIKPPTANVNASLLQNPRNAAFVAIDLIRTSFEACKHEPLSRRLAWYTAGGGCRKPGYSTSELRMNTALRLMKENPSL